MYVKISIKLLPFSRDSQIKLVKMMEKFEKISMIKETASFALSFYMPLEQIVIKLHVHKLFARNSPSIFNSVTKHNYGGGVLIIWHGFITTYAISAYHH